MSNIVTDEDVLEITPAFVPTFNAILSVMRLQDSKVAANAEKAKMIAKRRASQTISIATSNVTSSQTPSLPTSSGSTLLTLSGSTPVTQKRAAPDTISVHPAAKRSRQTRKSPSPTEPKTPDHQSTHPADPNLTHNSDESGGSMESKDEETTKWLINAFMENTLTVLGAPFRTLRWQQDQSELELIHTYIYNLLETNCTEGKMRQR
jgi:hypothetical protein